MFPSLFSSLPPILLFISFASCSNLREESVFIILFSLSLPQKLDSKLLEMLGEIKSSGYRKEMLREGSGSSSELHILDTAAVL